MTLSLSLINAAKKIVASSNTKIPANKYNSQVCKLVEVGNFVGNAICLSRSDLREIDEYFTSALGETLLTYDLSADSRMDMAKQKVDEKSAKGGVFQQLISLAGHANIPLKSQPDVPKEATYVVSVTLDDLDFHRFARVLFIENGELLVRWQKVVSALPVVWQSAVLIYRGHGKNQKYLPKLIENFDKKGVEVGFFFDYDPAGLDMVDQLSSNKHSWIVPKENLALFKSINKLDSFADQLEQLENVKIRTDSYSIRAHLNYIEANTLALTQEHLVNNQSTLVAERLK